MNWIKVSAENIQFFSLNCSSHSFDWKCEKRKIILNVKLEIQNLGNKTKNSMQKINWIWALGMGNHQLNVCAAEDCVQGKSNQPNCTLRLQVRLRVTCIYRLDITSQMYGKTYYTCSTRERDSHLFFLRLFHWNFFSIWWCNFVAPKHTRI